LTPKSIFVTALILALDSARGICSDPASAPIATDRPAVTASSIVVPAGSLQAENGLAVTESDGQQTLDIPETLFRFGLASKTELRLTTPNYLGITGGESGWSDLAVGVKQQLGPIHGFDLSMILSLSTPTGSQAISSHGYDPSAQLPWSRSIATNWTLAGMLSVYNPTQNGQRLHTGEATFLIDHNMTKSCDVFLEYAGQFPSQGEPRHLVQLGGAFRPALHHQLDFRVGWRDSGVATERFLGVGYSFRIQLFRR
jgi:hypothetical protein